MKKFIHVAAVVLAMAAITRLADMQARSSRKPVEIGTARRFVFLFTPGPAWEKGWTIADLPEETLGRHFAYMEKLKSENKLLLGGPFTDNTGAMGVLSAEGLPEARKLMDNDPLVQAKLVRVEVHPWHPAITGCVETKK